MKAKTNGRRYRSSEEWRVILARQAGSGLTIREFCQGEALCEQGFFRARKRLGAQLPERRPRFVELNAGMACDALVRVELQLPSGAVLRIA